MIIRLSLKIEPKSEIEVQIILQPFKEEPAEDYKCKDKFLVQTATLNESVEQQDISSMWSYIESTDRQSMHQHKIKCVFVVPKKEENEQVADDHVEKTAATTTPTTTTTTFAHTDADKTTTDAAASAITAAAATTGITTTEQEPSEQVTANKEESQIPSHNDVIPTSIVPPVPQQPAPPVEEAHVPSEPLEPVAAVPVREIEQEKESEEKKRLREALETIKRLEKEIEQLKKSQDEGLRERKEAVGGRKLAPTVQPLDAVHQHLAQLEKPRAVEGYPPQVMLGVAILVFIFTYLFF
ncbi:hypothetical protein G6F22_012734 [Rhizopus arrhizus]|nr:hypothetical protein G6F22_012734 [Rhizopus arrhizus]